MPSTVQFCFVLSCGFFPLELFPRNVAELAQGILPAFVCMMADAQV